MPGLFPIKEEENLPAAAAAAAATTSSRDQVLVHRRRAGQDPGATGQAPPLQQMQRYDQSSHFSSVCMLACCRIFSCLLFHSHFFVPYRPRVIHQLNIQLSDDREGQPQSSEDTLEIKALSTVHTYIKQTSKSPVCKLNLDGGAGRCVNRAEHQRSRGPILVAFFSLLLVLILLLFP